MILAIKEYVLKIIGVSVIFLLIDCFIKDDGIKRFALFASSIILIFVLILPLSKIKDIEFDNAFESDSFKFDYTEAVKKTVNGVKGYENADVSVEQSGNSVEKIYIKRNNEYLLEDAVGVVSGSVLSEILSSVYGVSKENIFISG